MFKEMRRQASQQTDDRGSKWAVRTRRVLRAIPVGVSSCFRACARAGQRLLSVVRFTSKRTPGCATHTPYKLRQDGQSYRQSDNAVCELSRFDARLPDAEGELEVDIVESVEFSGEVDYTYNLEIENTHNYFANGVLLHNCDDPHGAQEAQSDAMRNNTLEWLDVAWSTRKNDPRSSFEICIMQRLHDVDASGHYLKQGGWEHLCLPAEYDEVRRKTSLGEYDPRTTQGELLWPNRFGRPELDALKKALGSSYNISGQLQQQPSPEGGGILKVSHVQLWPANKVLPDIQYIVQSYDTAFTERTTGDPTGCITFGVFNYKDKQNVLILDAWTEHLAYPDLKERVMDDWKARYGGQKDHPTDKGRRPDVILVEAKASGQSLLQDLRQSNIPAVAYNPGKADKVQRAHMMAPILESDCIWVIESSKNPREPVSWVKPVLENWEKFPVVAHDELTDCAGQAVIFLKDNGWLDVPYHEDDDEQERYADASTRRHNPYGA